MVITSWSWWQLLLFLLPKATQKTINFLCKFMIEAVAPYPFFQKNTGMEKEIYTKRADSNY